MTLILLSVVAACDGGRPTQERSKEPSLQVERTLSFVTQLRLLPMPPSEEARYISIVDMPALSAANGLGVPERTDDSAVLEWTRVLAGHGTSPSVAGAELPWLVRGEPAAFTAETGLSAADFRTVASMITSPEEFTVVTGDFAGVEPARRLTEVEDGIVSVGKGDDYVAGGGGSRRGTDFYGRPVRLARTGDRIALSLSTPMARRWRDGRGASLADDPSLLAIGQRLDRTEALSAYLVAPRQGGGIGAYGVGWAVHRDAPLIVGVFDAGCAQGAQRLVAPLRQAFENGGRAGAAHTFKDVLLLKSISAEGRTALATLTLGDTASVLAPLEALENGSWPETPGPTSLC